MAGDSASLRFAYGGNAQAVRRDAHLTFVAFLPGNVLVIGQEEFELKSAHVHSPAEHRVNGETFAAELHLMHEHKDGRLAAVALIFRSGEPDATVQEILNAAPKTGATVADAISINSAAFRPDGSTFYRYAGSKTTPPCQEPVGRLVQREVQTVSAHQIEDLVKLNGGPNNRPIQPLGGRIIEAVEVQ